VAEFADLNNSVTSSDQVCYSLTTQISVLSLEISESVSDLGVWPVVLSEVERCLEKSSERERKRGEVIKLVGPVTVINWDPHKFSPDLNSAWIQKQAFGSSQICHETHIKFKLGFQSSLKLCVQNIFFLVGPNDYGFESLNHNLKPVYQTPS
jgi:hypothetical protein